MEIPLEILRAILSHAETVLSFTELLQLRLVNCMCTHHHDRTEKLIFEAVFDRELLSRLFTDHRSLRAPLSQYKDLPSSTKYRFINGNIWNLAPPSLRRKYIHYRLEAHTSEPSLFTYVFLPVYNRWLQNQGIALDNVTEKNRVLDTLLDLVTCSKLAGATIAHDSRKTPIMIERTFPVSASENTAGEKDSQNLLRQEQTDFEIEFARFAFALLNDEPQAIRILKRGIDLKRQSLCFGSSLFLFCIRRGSINLLHQMLKQDPSLVYEKKRPYIIFAAAAERAESGRECVNILLHHSKPMENFRRRNPFLESLSKKAGQLGHLPVVQGVLDWFEDHWKPNSSVSSPTETDLAAAKGSALWLNDPECRHRLLQRTYSKILSFAPYGGYITNTRDIFFVKPDIALLHLLLRNGIDVDDYGRSRQDDNPLYRATRRGMLDWAEAMLQAGAGYRQRYSDILGAAHRAGILDEMVEAIHRCGHEIVPLYGAKGTPDSHTWRRGTWRISWKPREDPVL